MSSPAVPLLLLLTLTGCQEPPADSNSGTSGAAAASSRPLPTDEDLLAQLDEVLRFTREERSLSLEKHAAWQILHGVLAYGAGFEVLHGDKPVPALQWVLDGGHMNGWSMRPGPHGVIADLEEGSKQGQGHPDQWLAIVSQCDLPSSQPLVVGGRQFKLGDLLNQAMFDVYEGKECSWTIIALSEYLRPEHKWQARDGSTWDLERLVAMEAGSPDNPELGHEAINDSACGGSHRLIGMTMAVRRYQRWHPDRSLTGGWKTAQERIAWAVDTARKYQLESGAFSVQYFTRPANASDLSEHLGATGHTLEFLSLALDEEQLAEPWVVRAAVYLCDLFERTRSVDLECGALYHAAHGLVLYRTRRFGPLPEKKIEGEIQAAQSVETPVR